MDTTFQNIQYSPSSAGGQSLFKQDETSFSQWSPPPLPPSVGQNSRFNYNIQPVGSAGSANSDVSKQKLPQFLAPTRVHEALQSLGLNKHQLCNFIMSFCIYSFVLQGSTPPQEEDRVQEDHLRENHHNQTSDCLVSRRS